MNYAGAQPVLELRELQHSFHQGSREISVLKGASATLHAGQAVALVGPSGSGKSTLLHIAGLLETPTAGAVVIQGRDCGVLPDSERTRVRRSQMGFIYQFHQLLPEFSALENVMMPQLISGFRRRKANGRAKELLGVLGLGDRLDHRPAQLSGGEQQRTSIARALAIAPKLILADEPTGNLDPRTADRVFGELVTLIRKEGAGALIATHNLDLARNMDRVLVLQDGMLVEVAPQSVS